VPVFSIDPQIKNDREYLFDILIVFNIKNFKMACSESCANMATVCILFTQCYRKAWLDAMIENSFRQGTHVPKSCHFFVEY